MYFICFLVAVVAGQSFNCLLLKSVVDQLFELGFFDTYLIVKEGLFPGSNLATCSTQYLISDFSFKNIG